MKTRLLTHRHRGFPTAQALEDFVRTHGRGGICYRSAETFEAAMQSGVLVAILDESDTILAMSGVLPLIEGKFEVGGALVRADYTGFGLQSFMLAARFAAVDAWKIAPWPQIYTGTARADYGAGSRGRVEALRFHPIEYEEGPVELREECETCSKPRPDGFVCCYQFYRAGPDGPAYTYMPGIIELIHPRETGVLTLDLPQI